MTRRIIRMEIDGFKGPYEVSSTPQHGSDHEQYPDRERCDGCQQFVCTGVG